MLNRAAVERTRDYLVHEGYARVEQEIAGRKLDYFLVPQSLNQNLLRFAVAVVSEDKQHHVFGVADTVPEAYRPFWALHEHVEFLEEPDSPDRCIRALNKELEAVPTDIRKEYIITRLQFFRDLIAYSQTDGEKSSQGGLTKATARFQKSLSRLEELAAETT